MVATRWFSRVFWETLDVTYMTMSPSRWSKNIINTTGKIILILCSCTFLTYVDPTHTFSPTQRFCQLFMAPLLVRANYLSLSDRKSRLHVCVELFLTLLVPKLAFSRLVLGNWEQNGEIPSTRTNLSLKKPPFTRSLWCRGESSALLTGNVGGSSRKPARGVTFASKTNHIRIDVCTSIRKQSYAGTYPTSSSCCWRYLVWSGSFDRD